ncbi:MAG: TldD/PmbA family protein [Methanobacteriota archaeon]|nr:MAG: TldD/PmbA family protein [Euryarchaeota archaeon]
MSYLKETAAQLVEAAREEDADDAIAEVFDSSIDQIRYSNSMIDTSNHWETIHAHVFVAVGSRTMASDVRDLRRGADTVREVVGLARKSPVNKDYGGIASGRFKYKSGRVDKRIASLRNPAKYVLDAIDGAVSGGAPDVGGTFFVRNSRWGIASSKGASAEDANASLDLSVRAFTQPEASGQAVLVTANLDRMKASETGARAAELAISANDSVPGEEGKLDLVMEPLFLGGVVGATASMVSGLSVELGMSMFDKKIGKQVASEEITLADDPFMKSMSRRMFDHEGRPSRKNVVIKNGSLKMLLHNTSTAKRFKVRPTASTGPLVATLFSMPSEPMMFHPVLETGDQKIEELVEDVKNGLYINNTWYTRFQNYSTGDFSTIPRDAVLRIRNGEVIGAVKNIRVSDNLMKFWKNVDALSRTPEEIYWWDEAAPPAHLPAARVRKMRITRSS